MSTFSNDNENTMTDAEWSDCLRQMDEHENLIRAWEQVGPKPDAQRCVHSRHRTLAHLRSCQETWLEACMAFAEKDYPRLKMLHPWRSFEQKHYELVSWEDHLATYLKDRARWKELLQTTDRTRKGKLNGKEFSIEDLTSRLVSHEHHHLFTPR